MQGVLAAVLVSLLAAAGFAATAAAAAAPAVQFIPPKFTANGSFIAHAPVTIAGSARLRFIVGETYPTATGPSAGTSGMFLRSGDTWICYFSNTDPNSTCGPSPFDQVTATLGPSAFFNFITTLQTASDPGNDTNQEIHTGSIRLVPMITVAENGSASVLVSALTLNGAGAPVTGVTMDAYFPNLTAAGTKALAFNPVTGFYAGSLQLAPGAFFLAFSAASSTNPDDFGGQVERVVVPGEHAAACAQPAAQAGLPLSAEAASFDALVTAGKQFSKTGFKLTNTGNATLSLLAPQIPASLAATLDIVLENASLAPNATTFYAVVIKPLTKAVSVGAFINVTSNGTVVGKIPVTVGTSILGGEPIACTAQSGQFVVSPATWFAQGIAGQALAKDFTVTNGADTAISVNATASGALAQMAFASQPIPAGGAGKLTATITPANPGLYQGTVAILGPGGSQSIFVGLQAFADAGTGAAGLQTELDNLVASLSPDAELQLSSVTDSIQSLIDQAASSYASGQYDVAQEKLAAAKARLATYQDVAPYVVPPDIGPPLSDGGGISPLILALVGVLAALAVVFVVLKKRGKGRPKDEAQLEEEFGEEPKGEEDEEF